jgi:hypothetical protein
MSTFVDGTATNDEIYTSIAISKKNSVNNFCFIEKEFFPGFKLQTKVIELDVNLYYKIATDYGSSSNDETFKIVATKDRGYAIVGYTQGYNAILTDVFFLKLDSLLDGGNFSIVSVNELEKNDINIKVFPNPSSSIINIKTSIEIKNSELHLFDLLGNEIILNNKIINSDDNTITINLADLTSGIYFLKIHNHTEKVLFVR